MSKTTLFDSRIKKYAYREAAQLYGELGSSPAGLSPEQVERQREKYGSNCFGSRSSDTMLRRLRRAFINPFNVILFVLGSISLVTDGLLASDFSKNATTALIIFSMILISGGIRLVQELRAKNAAQQLDRLIHQRIRVRRGGVCMDIPAEELVVGDVVLLSAGDRVPADLRLTAVTDLFLSQAAITGEHPVLLLDDVLSELDDGRKQYLLTRMREKQTFVTSCDDTAFLKTDGEVYRMNGGMLTKV